MSRLLLGAADTQSCVQTTTMMMMMILPSWQSLVFLAAAWSVCLSVCPSQSLFRGGGDLAVCLPFHYTDHYNYYNDDGSFSYSTLFQCLPPSQPLQFAVHSQYGSAVWLLVLSFNLFLFHFYISFLFGRLLLPEHFLCPCSLIFFSMDWGYLKPDT